MPCTFESNINSKFTLSVMWKKYEANVKLYEAKLPKLMKKIDGKWDNSNSGGSV
jgi:hypothetical protein